jgi:hypothetical protein
VATYQGAKDWMMVKNEVVRMWMEGIVAWSVVPEGI